MVDCVYKLTFSFILLQMDNFNYFSDLGNYFLYKYNLSFFWFRILVVMLEKFLYIPLLYTTKSGLKDTGLRKVRGPPLYSLRNDCIDLLLQHDTGQTRIYNPLFGKIGRLHRTVAPYLANCSMPSSRSRAIGQFHLSLSPFFSNLNFSLTFDSFLQYRNCFSSFSFLFFFFPLSSKSISRLRL